jgi:hypothetical protein
MWVARTKVGEGRHFSGYRDFPESLAFRCIYMLGVLHVKAG